MSKEKTADIKLPSLEELLKAGVHFGHQSRRWHPRMSKYIYATKKGVHIFNLEKTQEMLKKAAQVLEKIANDGGDIIFVGTKRQSSTIIEEAARSCGAMFVTQRWLGGTITNYESIKKNLKKLKDLQKGLASNKYKDHTKKERLILKRELTHLESLVGGIVDLGGLPAALFVVDPRREKTAVSEANKKGIVVVAVVDTNCDPSKIDYVIPANDDSSRSIKIISQLMAAYIKRGYEKIGRGITVKEKPMRDEEDQKVAILGLSTRSLNALKARGIETVKELKRLSEEDLLKIKGLGGKSVKEIVSKI